MAVPSSGRSLAGTLTSAPRRAAVYAALLGVLAVAVSATGSWIPSLWGDEAASLMSATRPFSTLLPMLQHVDAVHGVYYMFLHCWVDVFGPSPFSIRFPSAIAIGVCTAAVSWMSSRLHSPRFGVLAGVMVMVVPRLTYDGEEARSYAMDAALAAVLFALVIEILARHVGTRKWWIAYTVVLIVGTYLFLYTILVTVAVGVFLLTRPSTRRRVVPWLIASACAAVAATPIVVMGYLERGQISYLGSSPTVTFSSVFMQMNFETLFVSIVSWALLSVAIVWFVIGLLRRRRALAAATRASGAAFGAAAGAESARLPGLDVLTWLGVCWLVVPMGILIALSPFVSLFTSRYGAISAPAAGLLVAVAIARLSRRQWVAIVLAVAYLACVVPVWAGQRTPYAKNGSDWNVIAATISAKAHKGDGILFDNKARPSRRPELALSTNPRPFAKVVNVSKRTPYQESKTWYGSFYTVAEAAALGRMDGIDRVWLVEYKSGSKVDNWGISDLHALGYHEAERIDQHSSVTYLFTR